MLPLHSRYKSVDIYQYSPVHSGAQEVLWDHSSVLTYFSLIDFLYSFLPVVLLVSESPSLYDVGGNGSYLTKYLTKLVCVGLICQLGDLKTSWELIYAGLWKNYVFTSTAGKCKATTTNQVCIFCANGTKLNHKKRERDRESIFIMSVA